MKILYLKAGKIEDLSGGGLETRKMMRALKAYAQAHDQVELTMLSEDYVPEGVAPCLVRNRWKDVLARVFLHSSYVWVDWRWGKLAQVVEEINPDLLLLGNSRLGFVAETLKNQGSKTRVISHYHNVEADYVQAAFGHSRGLTGWLMRKIEMTAVTRDERNAVEAADHHVVLTRRDADRLHDLYGLKDSKVTVLPTCLATFREELRDPPEEPLHLVFLGSLWYNSNREAIEWFLDHVWKDVKKSWPEIRLTIGGSRPPDKLVQRLAEEPSVRFFPNFNNVSEVIFKRSVMIAPLQQGAGMKVKVAEALSMGFPVLASREALAGYEESLADPLSEGVLFHTETPGDYLQALDRVMVRDYTQMSEAALTLFERYYAQGRADETVSRMLEPFNNEYGNLASEKISIVVSCYNAEKTIEEAVQSVLDQTHAHWELIMVDDGSRDDTHRLLLEAAEKDHRIQVISLGENQGVAVGRNTGMARVNSRYLAFLDADDRWHPAKLERQLALMKEKQAAIVFNSYRWMNEQGKWLNTVVRAREQMTYLDMLKGNRMASCTVLLDLAQTGPVRFKKVRHEDYVLWLELLKAGHTAWGLDEVLAYYRRNARSLSGNKLRSAWWTWQVLRNQEKLGLYPSVCYFTHYALRNLGKLIWAAGWK